jgi:hypothetical protein
MTDDEPTTRWRLTQTPGRPRLELELVVNTTAPAVVDAIEQAAARAGVELERLEDVGR